ncbi:hypothetical protein DPMN_057933 [Dreissena polymorpha]|uniref:Uncharacterized protein n=1 Tax=Dreissena polymorpha TaxID=45954 RepID=A0A9D4C0V2_DREPO|nr:hypothetical protein DPMN_057933 [Dreissena polymorpha]
MVPSKPLQPSQPTMPATLNITTPSAAMPPIQTVSDDVAAHIPDQLKKQIRRGEYINFSLLLKGSVELQSHLSVEHFQIQHTAAWWRRRKNKETRLVRFCNGQTHD